jgi:hypothetical protein
VSENVVTTIHAEDGMQTTVDLLPVLSPDRMASLLGAELESRGFTIEGDTATRTEPDGLVIVVDLRNNTLNVSLGSDDDVNETVNLEARVANPVGAEDKLRDDAMNKLDEQIAKRTDALRQEITQRLEGRLGDVKKEIDQAVNVTTVNALTEKAQQLGHIQDVSKDEVGNVTIRVKL